MDIVVSQELVEPVGRGRPGCTGPEVERRLVKVSEGGAGWAVVEMIVDDGKGMGVDKAFGELAEGCEAGGAIVFGVAVSDGPVGDDMEGRAEDIEEDVSGKDDVRGVDEEEGMDVEVSAGMVTIGIWFEDGTRTAEDGVVEVGGWKLVLSIGIDTPSLGKSTTTGIGSMYIADDELSVVMRGLRASSPDCRAHNDSMIAKYPSVSLAPVQGPSAELLTSRPSDSDGADVQHVESEEDAETGFG